MESDRSEAPSAHGPGGLVVVHRGDIEAIDGILDRLRSEGIEAVALDDPNFVIRLVAFGTYRVRVAVPREEEADARAALERWSLESAGSLDGWSRELRSQAVLALLPTALACAWVLVEIEPAYRLPWLAGVIPATFLGAFVLIALVKRR